MTDTLTKETLRVPGIGRDADYADCLILYLNRPASDDEMRTIHDAVRAALTTQGGEG